MRIFDIADHERMARKGLGYILWEFRGVLKLNFWEFSQTYMKYSSNPLLKGFRIADHGYRTKRGPKCIFWEFYGDFRFNLWKFGQLYFRGQFYLEGFGVADHECAIKRVLDTYCKELKGVSVNYRNSSSYSQFPTVTRRALVKKKTTVNVLELCYIKHTYI